MCGRRTPYDVDGFMAFSFFSPLSLYVFGYTANEQLLLDIPLQD